MAIYSVAEAKNKLPAMLKAVERGESVTITRRGKPIVQLMPALPGTVAEDAEDDLPAYGSTAWVLTEMRKLPPIPGDLQATLRAMRDGTDGW